MTMIPLDTIKAYMGIATTDVSKDALLGIFQASVEQQVLNFCECDFSLVVTTSEIHDGTNADVIVPNKCPIVSVQAIYRGTRPDGTQGQALNVGTDYYFDPNAITLVNQTTPLARGNIRLDYTSGYATVPGDIVLCICEAVKANYQKRSRNSEDLSSRSKGDEGESYVGAWDKKTGLPVSVAAKLQPYRVYEFPNINTTQRNQ